MTEKFIIPWEEYPVGCHDVLFQQKINVKYAMFSHPSDNGHTPLGDIYISYSLDINTGENTKL